MNINSENTPSTNSIEDYGDILVFTNKGPRGGLPTKIRKDLLFPAQTSVLGDVVPFVKVISAADVLTSNDEKKIVLPTAPAGTIYSFETIKAIGFDGSDYGTNVDAIIYYQGAEGNIGYNILDIDLSSDAPHVGPIPGESAPALVAGSGVTGLLGMGYNGGPVVFFTRTGNPVQATNPKSILIWGTYRLLDFSSLVA